MNKILIEKIRKVYTTRLLEALKEVDVVDNEGNVLISQDLKVFHKGSGYEYTVDDVIRTPDGIKVVLRNPESPRFSPADSTQALDEVSDEVHEYLTVTADDDNPDDAMMMMMMLMMMMLIVMMTFASIRPYLSLVLESPAPPPALPRPIGPSHHPWRPHRFRCRFEDNLVRRLSQGTSPGMTVMP